MPEVAYSPARVDVLRRAVYRAADELAGLACPDPAADDALRVVALAEHNLRESWIPLLTRIEASDAMCTWGQSGPQLPEERSTWSVLDIDRSRFDDLIGLALIARLRGHAGGMIFGDDGQPVAGMPSDEDRQNLDDAILRQLARDPQFEQELLRAIAEHPESAWMLTGELIPGSMRADALAALLTAAWGVPGYDWAPLAGAADELMTGLIHDPASALGALGDPAVLTSLAEWPPLDQSVVAEFVNSALAKSVELDPAHHAAGVTVLENLTALANTARIDHVGMPDGLSIGVASSIGVFLPSFIDTIRIKTATIAARSEGVGGRFDVTLGTYEEVVDLFGALMRDSPAAQEHLGVELAALTRMAVEASDDLPGSVRIDTVAEFAELLRDAAANEDAENTIAAAARRATLLDSAALFGLGASALLVAVKAGGELTRLVVDRGVGDAADFSSRSRGSQIGAPDYGKATHDMIVTSAARRLVSDPALRRQHGADADGWSDVQETLDELEQIALGYGDPDHADRLLYDLEARARDLGGGRYLDDFLSRPSVHTLTEASPNTD